MRRAAKVDANHAVVVGGLRACGAKVLSLAAIGKGCPDLLILHRGRLQLLEVKDGRKPPSARALTPDQVDFHAEWPVTVVASVEQAIAALIESNGAAALTKEPK
jgi:hypothetical protein